MSVLCRTDEQRAASILGSGNSGEIVRVDHVIGHAVESLPQDCAELGVAHLRVQHLVHAQQPLIALCGPDAVGWWRIRRRGWPRSCPHSGGPPNQPLRNSNSRSSLPVRLSGCRRQHVPGLGQFVHRFVEAVYQAAHGVDAAKAFVGRG